MEKKATFRFLETLKEMDWRQLSLAKWVLWVPFALVAIYFLLLAENRYVSEARLIVVKNGDSASSAISMALPILGLAGNSSQEDTRYLKEYIQSPEMFEVLDKKMGLRAAFVLHGLDVFYMLPDWVSKEYALEYYRNRIDLAIDDRTGILTVKTEGFSPEFAKHFNEAVLKESERFINELSYQIAREQLDFAGQEVARARKGLDSIKNSLLSYQEKKLDPVTLLGVTSQIVTGLESTLAGKEAELKAALGTMQEGAPQVIALRHMIAALKEQIRNEQSKLSSTDGDKLNRRAADYTDQKAMVDFQAELYRITLAAFEKTRVDTMRKIKSLAVISAPQLPERAEYPRRFYSLISSFFLLIMGYGFIRLAGAVVEDHRD